MAATPISELSAEGVYTIENAAALETPFFLNSPHSGEMFPAEFLARSQLRREVLRRASDLYVDRLFAPVVAAGLPLMRALMPRSYLDLNREPLELDPRLIAGVLPVEANTRSLRVAGGLGTVPRVIGDQIEIYAGKITLEEALSRIDRTYVPYHMRLHRELALRHGRHGGVVLLDLHSMPSQSMSRVMPDIVLGDRFGGSCAAPLMAEAERAFRAAGFRVERNQPYAGGYITEHYGRPDLGWHALQIEVSRALYMDEARLEMNQGFVDAAETLSGAIAVLVAAVAETKLFDFHKTALHFLQKAAE
ncbi:MAG TPA: N-formylglutamate amidohydrolase [Rhabdaerophilum sp.]|nr:N-formylglutamate amidohydrolase [Rhabdaerophilum sp.]